MPIDDTSGEFRASQQKHAEQIRFERSLMNATGATRSQARRAMETFARRLGIDQPAALRREFVPIPAPRISFSETRLDPITIPAKGSTGEAGLGAPGTPGEAGTGSSVNVANEGVGATVLIGGAALTTVIGASLVSDDDDVMTIVNEGAAGSRIIRFTFFPSAETISLLFCQAGLPKIATFKATVTDPP